MAKYCKKENVENSNSHDKPVVASGTVYRLDSKTLCDNYVTIMCLNGNIAQWWLELNDELSWLFTKEPRAFYLICRK